MATATTIDKPETTAQAIPSYPRRDALGIGPHQGATGSANDIALSDCPAEFEKLFIEHATAASELAEAREALSLIDSPNVAKFAQTSGMLGSLKAELDSSKDDAERAQMVQLAQDRVTEAEDRTEQLRQRRDDCAIRADYFDSMAQVEVIAKKWNTAIAKANKLRDEALAAFAAEVSPLIENHGGRDSFGHPWPETFDVPTVAPLAGSAAEGAIVHPSSAAYRRRFE